VYGVTGSGKTTLARRIGEITGLPWHCMDDEVGWLPRWVERPVEEQVRMVARLVAAEMWVLDTAYGHWRDLVLARTDLVVALDSTLDFSHLAAATHATTSGHRRDGLQRQHRDVAQGVLPGLHPRLAFP